MIILEHIKKTYYKSGVETVALKDVSLEIKKGEMLAVIGRSGSGKSTLLNIIGAMDSADEGIYRFGDTVVSSLKGKALHEFRKEHIGFIFQSFELMPQYTVYENVEMPLLVRNVKKRKEIILKVLKRVGIDDMKDKRVEYLSGGQQQRCAIARAIAMKPDIILADEPTGALDRKTNEEIMDLLEEIHQGGTTIIIVTHDPQVAERANRIVCIEDGMVENR